MYHPQLYTFVKVVECGSFAKAAEALFLSRVSVMRQINSLEDRLNMQLLVRSSSGISLTPAGQSIYHDALQIIHISDAAVQKARRIEGSARRTIRVGTSLLNPCQPLISMWEDLKSDYPQYRLRPVPYSDDHTQASDLLTILGKDFDLFVGINDSLAWSDISSFLRIHDEPIVCAVPIAHPLAVRKILQVSDFDGRQVMMTTEGDSPANVRALSLLRQACPDIEVINVGKYYDIDVFHNCVEQNCLLLSFGMWEHLHPSLVTIPIDWDCAVPYGITYSQKPSAQVAEFIEIIRKHLSGDSYTQ